MDVKPRYVKGDRVQFIEDGNGVSKGDTGIISDANYDRYNGHRYIIVTMTTGSNVGKNITSFEENVKYSSPLAVTEFPMSREQLETIRKVLRNSQALDEPDAEEIAQQLDMLLDPPLERKYEIVFTGKADDIAEALVGLEVSDPVLKDKVAYTMVLKYEKGENT